MSLFSKLELIERLTARPPQELEPDPTVRWAAVCAVLRPRGDEDFDLLFIKRAAHEQDPWSGHMAFPGGRVEPDEDPLTAAVREVREEVGLDLTRSARHVTQLNDLQAMARGARMALYIRPYVFLLEEDPELVPDRREVEEVVWIPLSTLLAGEGLGLYSWHWQGTPLELPCVRYHHYLVWGLTYRMLCDMMELLGVRYP